MPCPRRRVVASLFFAVGSAAILFLTNSSSAAEEWARFRGPNGTGTSEAKDIPATWSDADYRWKAKLPGIGHSSPVIWGDKLFVTSADPSNGTRFVICLDAKDGSQKWTRDFPAGKGHIHDQNSFASSTPAADANQVYIAWATPEQVVLLALDHNGKDKWRLDLGSFTSEHGFGTSPVVVDDLVIMTDDQEGESYLVGVDCKSGKVRWKEKRRNAPGKQNTSYATPCIREIDGKTKELIVHSWGQGITAIDPKTGKTNWEMPDAFARRPVGSPILVGDLIMGNCGEGSGNNYVIAIKPGAKSVKPEVAFKVEKAISPYVPSLVSKDNLVFLWTDKGIVSCIDSADKGKVVWTKRIGGNYSGSPIRIGDRLYAISQDGDVVVLAAGNEFKQLGKIPLGEQSRATPAVAGGTMYLRTESQIFAVGGKKG